MKEEQATAGIPTVVGGVDTHKDLHVAAVVDGHDRLIAAECFPTLRHSSSAHEHCRGWSRSHDT